MGDIGGKLTIRLNRADSLAEIESSRPVSMSALLFRTKTPDEVAEIVPLLYSLCGVAQRCAALQALELAQGVQATEQTRRGRALLVELETLREHLTQILTVWPGLSGEVDTKDHDLCSLGRTWKTLVYLLNADGGLFKPGGEVAALPTVDKLSEAVKDLTALAQAAVFGCQPQEWLEIADESALGAWAEVTAAPAARLVAQIMSRGWQDSGRSVISSLPGLPAGALLHRLQRGGDSFVAAPDWNGKPHDTGALGRHCDHPLVLSLQQLYGNGLLPRTAARLIEVARLLCSLAQGGCYWRADNDEDLPDGVGLSQVEAARGRLVHMAALADGRIEDYRILAPTEWNFHPQGALAQGLKELKGGDDTTLEAQAHLLISTIDPCVQYELVMQ